MRPFSNVEVTNRNVFGFRQDRVVVSTSSDVCAHAAQHLSWHAAARVRSLANALLRYGWKTADTDGIARKAKRLGLAITGAAGRPERLMSPGLVG